MRAETPVLNRLRLIGAIARAPRESQRDFETLRRIAGILAPEYRFKWPQMAWWADDEFNSFLRRFGEENGLNADRRWMLWQLLRLIEDTPGDTAECGVYQGAGSYLICRANARSKEERTHHLFDSFEGLSAPSDIDGAHWRAGDLAAPEDEVRESLAEFDAIEIHRGWIPDRFGEVADCTFSFVHIDVDLHEPTGQSIEFFYPRLTNNGILVCDDYGFTTCPGATGAIDAFLADKPEAMVALPDGGGFLIKGRVTAEAGALEPSS